MDALEWGARSLPGESGAFLQISGLSYEIDVSTECEYLQGLCLEPQRRSAGENLTPGTVAVLVYADGTVDPQGFATRAQVAAMMQRFCALVAQ